MLRSRWFIQASRAALCALLIVSAVSAQAQPGASPSRVKAQRQGVRIRVTMIGFPDDQGVAIVALHFNQNSFPKAARAAQTRRVKIVGGQARAHFDHVAPGVYAVTVVHDRDQDGELGFSWWPYPHTTEYAGVSRNQPVRFGPPKYQNAKFVVKDQDIDIHIHMQI